MFFQSNGAVFILKVKAPWFHVRERGVFGDIFGTLISFGVYFAFDWGRAIADASRNHIENPTKFQLIFRFASKLGALGTKAAAIIPKTAMAKTLAATISFP